jgi:hypothetical protein
VSEALAVRLIPGVRERMSNPRYLTAMAVSLEVCRDFTDDIIARDKVSPPWQVFEWIAVEAFARTADGPDPFRLPGSEKAAIAIRERVPLSAARYLKTPNVFGFHGVYRGLARDLEIENGGRLGETGYELLTTWAKEQKLEGFTGSLGGNGASVCKQLSLAVRESLSAGAVARRDGWQYWGFFREHLAPDQTGPREAAILRDALFTDSAGFRGPVLRFLVSDQGRTIFNSAQSERDFHNALRRAADPALSSILEAIATYELFSRICQDAFDDVLVMMTRNGGRKATPTELGRIDTVKSASTKIPQLFNELLEQLEPFRETSRFSNAFAALAERTESADWADRLLDHHVSVQQRKAPIGIGKSPWFERFDDGSAIIRPLYRRDQPSRRDESYLHAYRTWSLYSFASDLRMFAA